MSKVITEETVREKLLGLRCDMDRVNPKHNHTLPHRQYESWYGVAKEVCPHLVAEIFPDWVDKPGGSSFCLVRKSSL